MPRSYWRAHCKATIPPPERLARRLLMVYYFFRNMDDPETGKPFFSAGHEKICRHELTYVAKGEVSDHPTIEVYALARTLGTGCELFHCLRTSSALEGYHQHFHDAIAKAAKAAGLHWTEACTNEFDFRWTVRALRRRGFLPSWMRHYNTALVDSLHSTLVKLGGVQMATRLLPGWRRSKLLKSPLVRHGFDYGLEAQKLPPATDAPPTTTTVALREPASEGAWLAERLGSSRPLRTRRTRADVEALLDAPASASAEEISRRALERGLHLTGKAAGGFAAEIEIEEAARLALEEADYRALQQELRTRADVRPNATLAELPAPTRRGSSALPVPLLLMSSQIQRPAALVALSDSDDDGGGSGGGGSGDDGGGGDGGGDGDDVDDDDDDDDDVEEGGRPQNRKRKRAARPWAKGKNGRGGPGAFGGPGARGGMLPAEKLARRLEQKRAATAARKAASDAALPEAADPPPPPAPPEPPPPAAPQSPAAMAAAAAVDTARESLEIRQEAAAAAKREWEAEMRAESSAAKLSRRLRGLELPGAQLFRGAEHMVRLAEEALREAEAAAAILGVAAA